MKNEAKKFELGVMQGRLLPKYKGRYQAHPVGYWAKEFEIAAQLELDCIEFILDLEDRELNPLMSTKGLNEIKAAVHKTGVKVKSICADCFMDAKFHSLDQNEVKLAQEILEHLILISPELGVTNIVIPCVDRSSISGSADAERFAQALLPQTALALKNGVHLALETDLSPTPFKELLARFKNTSVSVNYDIGNSASLGFKFDEEFHAYGTLMTDVHIKDRTLNGGSVELGSGAANIDEVLATLSSSQAAHGKPFYFIMQAYRDDEGVEVFKKQLAWFRNKLSNYF